MASTRQQIPGYRTHSRPGEVFKTPRLIRSDGGGVLNRVAIPLGLMSIALTCVQAADAQQRPMPARLSSHERFLKIERIARLPSPGQRYKLRLLYEELAPQVMSPIVESILSSYPRNILDHSAGFGNPGADHTTVWAGQLAAAAKKMSPEGVADRLKTSLWWNIAARSRAIQVLRAHPRQTAELVGADLKARTKQSVGRAANVILALELSEFSLNLLDCYIAGDETSQSAYYTLLFLHDPAVTKRLLDRVRADERFLIRCSGLFQGPFAGKPAAPLLLTLMQSDDDEVRFHAGWALSECRDDRLTRPAAKLASESEPRFRSQAATLALNLTDESFRSIRDRLLPLLKDKDETVRFDALRCFSSHKDDAAVPVLRNLLSRNELAEGHKVVVMQAMSSLANSTFQYDMHKWGPGTDRNLQAIRRFNAWSAARQQLKQEQSDSETK